MKITKVICGSRCSSKEAESILIQPEAKPDHIIRQENSGELMLQEKPDGLRQLGWTLQEKDICRYEIQGGKAKLVTRQTIDGERTFVENAATVCIGRAYEGKIQFQIQPEECIYGLGQQEDGILNHRGVTVHLYQNNMQIPMPVIVSSNGYGLFFDAACLMVYEEKDDVITMQFDAVDQIVYYVIEGSSGDEIIAGIRALTGKASMLPKWAFGYIQSRERYRSQQEILEIREEFARRNIPVSCLVLDWMSWEDGKWGNKQLDKQRFPHLKAMTDQLHKQDTAFMISVWPNMNKGTKNNEEMQKAGKLLANLSTYDAFDPQGRDLYWKQMKEEIVAAGTDAYWCDSTEPFTPDWNGTEKQSHEKRYALAKEHLTKYMDARKANAYALYHAKGIYENQRRENRKQRVVNLTRSGYPSIQKYGTILWSGDIAADWDTMRRQIAEGLSMCVSGMPYWTLDIGAFFTGTLACWRRFTGSLTAEGPQPWFWHGLFEDGAEDLGYRELYVRWLQFGAFLPVMRSHGTDTKREPWYYGEEGDVWYDTIVSYIRLRYRLLPYIYSMGNQVSEADGTMMRMLYFDFPGDKKACTLDGEYMFGDFLVCPVTEPMIHGPGSRELGRETLWKVYLPEGCLWYDYRTKECLEGGQELQADAPICYMPLYVRAGAIIPMDVDETGTGLSGGQEMKQVAVEVYAGQDGAFTLYLDEGNGYGYEDGVCVRIPIQYADKTRQIKIGNSTGKYPVPKDFMLHYYDREGKTQRYQVSYDGKEVIVQFSAP